MKRAPRRYGPQRTALLFALAYATVAGAWIWLSDRAAIALVRNADALAWVQSVKGFGFVAVTTTLLYALVLAYALRIDRRDRSLQRQRDRLALINRVHNVLRMVNATLLRLHGDRLLLDEACRATVHGGGFPCAWIALLDDRGRQLTTAAQACAGAGEAPVGIDCARAELAPDDAIGRALEGGAFGRVQAGADDTLLAAGPAHGVAEAAVVALRSGDDTLGVMALYSAEPGAFDDAEERALLVELADNVGLGLGYLRQRHALYRRDYFDELTGLGNRALIDQRLVAALNAAGHGAAPVAAVVVDIDGFSALNDTLGRAAGDEVLQAVAAFLDAQARGGETVGRFGNDEFALVLTELDDRNPVTRRVGELADRLPVHVTRGEQTLAITLSLGVAIYPDDAADAHELLARAELALHSREPGQTARIGYYSPALDTAARERRQLEQALRAAADGDAFDLAWQPVVDARSGETAGAEVLLRWHDPALGRVPPDRFVPVAEHCGLMGAIGARVVRRACERVDALGDAAAGFELAVNVSLQQLRTPELVAVVRRIMEARKSPHWDLAIELTEREFMADPDPVIATCERLRELGCRIYLDDFGTGYSALNYLTRLPIDGLKIDRSFVRQAPHDAGVHAILRALMTLARALGASVIAEGVETEQELESMRAIGCHRVQGFLYGYPGSFEALAARLAAPATDGR